MNIKDFFEHFILRDILAFTLPGSISLAGIYMAINSSGFEGAGQILPLLSGLDATSLVLFLLTSFLVGHLWDAVYRKLFQTNETFHRAGITKKMLIEDDHIASQIRSAVGQFINIDDWKKESGNGHRKKLMN